MENLTLALWPVEMGSAPSSVADAVDRIEARMADAVAAGAQLLMLPEYIGAQWLAWAAPEMPETEEVAWMGRHGAELLERLRPLPARHGLGLLAGTWPAWRDAAWANRAHLLLPDGRLVVQDKLCLTPAERDPDAWQLATGSEVRIVEWMGWRIAISICLDVEQPALAALLQNADLDLLLVPSMTRAASGHARVMDCAKARAVELMTTVATVGCVGDVPGHPPWAVTGGAAVYMPCEPSLGHLGVAVEQRGIEGRGDGGPLVIARNLPLARIRELRRGGAEVWPGAWSADHVRLTEG